MKKAYAAPTIAGAGDVVANTMQKGTQVLESDPNGSIFVSAVGFYL